MQYHSIHKNTNTEKRQMVLTYLRVQSLHASSLLVASSVHSHALAVLHTHVITCQLYTSCFLISCISVVTIVLILMHEGCCTMKCGSTTCRNYDHTCDGGRILVM